MTMLRPNLCECGETVELMTELRSSCWATRDRLQILYEPCRSRMLRIVATG